MNARGFTVIELIVAAAIVVIVSSAVAALASPMRRAFDRGLSATESASRARTVLNAIVSEVRSAGSGVVIGPTGVTLADVMPVLSALSPSSLGIVRATGTQGLLREHVDAGAMTIRIDDAQPCSEQDPTCGIRAGDAVVIFDAIKGETIGVVNVSEPPALHLASPLHHAFDAGAVVATIAHSTIVWREGRLLRITAGGAEQPIADGVMTFNAAVSAARVDLQFSLHPAAAGGMPFELRTSVAIHK